MKTLESVMLLPKNRATYGVLILKNQPCALTENSWFALLPESTPITSGRVNNNNKLSTWLGSLYINRHRE